MANDKNNKNFVPETRIAVFKSRGIRKTLHNNEWWFVIEDVVLALIDSKDPKQYIQRMKQRDPELGKGWVQIVHTLSRALPKTEPPQGKEAVSPARPARNLRPKQKETS